MRSLKKFKVFYFLDGDHQGIDETRRKWELIMGVIFGCVSHQICY